jgi:hypothetical protein
VCQGAAPFRARNLTGSWQGSKPSRVRHSGTPKPPGTISSCNVRGLILAEAGAWLVPVSYVSRACLVQGGSSASLNSPYFLAFSAPGPQPIISYACPSRLRQCGSRSKPRLSLVVPGSGFEVHPPPFRGPPTAHRAGCENKTQRSGTPAGEDLPWAVWPQTPHGPESLKMRLTEPPVFCITAACLGGDLLPPAAPQRAGTFLGARPLLIEPEADDDV